MPILLLRLVYSMKALLVLLAIAAVFHGCAETEPAGKTPAEQLFREAQRLQKEGSLILATEKLTTLRSKYPYSFYATQAELMLADIQFEQEDYINAAASYIRFRDFHPKSDRIAYVIFRIGESFYKQLPETYDRDLSTANDAIKYFRELIRRYPGAEQVELAKNYIRQAQKKLRRKEKYIADFYFKTEVFEAARYRYLLILKNFQNEKLRLHSMQRIVESSLAMDRPRECLRYAEEFLPKLPLNQQGQMKKTVSKCLEMRENEARLKQTD